MSYYTIPLQAGMPARFDIAGRVLLVDDCGAAGSVDVQLMRAGTPQTKLPNRKKAFRQVAEYDGVILTAAVDTTVGIFLSYDDVSLGVADGSAVSVPSGVVITNAPGQKIPVDIGGATVNVGTLAIQLAGTVTDAAPVAIGAGATAIAAANAARRGMRLRNVGANPVAIGGAGVTFANAAVILQAGETWNENEAPGAAWYGICGAGLASTLNLQTIA